MISRKPKLRRQRKIFRQQGKIPRPEQMNINVATWGRLLKRNLNFQKSVPQQTTETTAGQGNKANKQHNHDASATGRKEIAIIITIVGYRTSHFFNRSLA